MRFLLWRCIQHFSCNRYRKQDTTHFNEQINLFLKCSLNNYSNTRSFPDASARNQAVVDAAPNSKKDEIETPPVQAKEKKDSFVPYRKDGSLDYDGKVDLNLFCFLKTNFQSYNHPKPFSFIRR